MTYGLLIYRNKDIVRNSAFINLLQEAASARKMRLDIIPYEQINLGLSSHNPAFRTHGNPDFIINRSVSPWLNEIAELKGIRCFNRTYISRIANDKRLAHAVLSNLDIPMLQSTAVHRNYFNESDLEFHSPFILKDPLGRGGTGVELIDPSKAVKNNVASLPEDLLHQPVGGQKGKDLRIYIINNKIVGAVLRESATDFRANLSTGGNSSLYELDEQEILVIEKITDAMQMDFVGLDFLIAEDGSLLFNEMEDAVGCRSLYINSSINIADLFIDYIFQQMVS